mmetsp:Transcript_16138/g.22749  ORF Transcript_16138/g.22749 Transcript_16138/m.22749 type:complete len:341 (-) Transcript_16138:295-1317(-)
MEIPGFIHSIKEFVLKWFLPCGFAVAILVALTYPEAGTYVSKFKFQGFRIVQTLNVMVIFFISGLKLKAAEAKAAVSKEGSTATIYGLVMILLVTPLAGFVAIEIPFQVKEFSYGLAVFAATPTTIAAGVALVALSEGNSALALLLTVFSNLIGVVTTPFWLKFMLASTDVEIDAVDLLIKMFISVLVPLVIGQVIHNLVPSTVPWCASHKILLRIISITSLSMIVWQTISRSASEILSVSGEAMITIIAAGFILHIAYLAITWPVCKYVLKLAPAELKAVVIMSTEKPLPVCVAIITFLTTLGSEGMLTIPAIVGQQTQLFIDSFIAGKWSEKAPELPQ